MVDIHHHLLPGVDDGAVDMETSIAMVELAVEDGVTHIVATPHANNVYEYDRPAHEALLQELREALPPAVREKIKLGLGCDFHLLFENVEEAKADPTKFSINGKGYLMVELPDHGIPRTIEDVLYDLRVAGMIPVLTHPERNATLQANPEILKSWLQGGLLLQVTANSITGDFGKGAQRVANLLLKNHWVHFVSSDAHSVGRRNPRLSPAYAVIAKRFGEESAQRLFVSNPLAAFEGRELPEQPEPFALHEDLEPRSWWQRLFSK